MNENERKKMKELADRLVAMSPEPPDFPEEVAMTQPTESKPARPVWAFVGAAVVVLLLAGIPLFLMRGGGEVEPVGTSTTTSTLHSSSTSEQAVTSTSSAPASTAPAETTSTPAVPEQVDAIVYLTTTPVGSNTGNPALVAFRYLMNVDRAVLWGPPLPGLAALSDPDLVPPEGFENLVPSAVGAPVGTSVDGSQITIDYGPEFLDGAGGLLADFTMLNQIVFTATQEEGIDSVQFLVDGQPITAFGSEGLDLTEPVTRESFLTEVNSILVTTPVEGVGHGSIEFGGIANVFEATVNMQLLDDTGQVVHEDVTMATCGTGCWGEYSFQVVDQEPPPPTLRVFTYSAKDGSPQDVVTIPIAWNNPEQWGVLGG